MAVKDFVIYETRSKRYYIHGGEVRLISIGRALPASNRTAFVFHCTILEIETKTD